MHTTADQRERQQLTVTELPQAQYLGNLARGLCKFDLTNDTRGHVVFPVRSLEQQISLCLLNLQPTFNNDGQVQYDYLDQDILVDYESVMADLRSYNNLRDFHIVAPPRDQEQPPAEDPRYGAWEDWALPANERVPYGEERPALNPEEVIEASSSSSSSTSPTPGIYADASMRDDADDCGDDLPTHTVTGIDVPPPPVPQEAGGDGTVTMSGIPDAVVPNLGSPQAARTVYKNVMAEAQAPEKLPTRNKRAPPGLAQPAPQHWFTGKKEDANDKPSESPRTVTMGTKGADTGKITISAVLSETTGQSLGVSTRPVPSPHTVSKNHPNFKGPPVDHPLYKQ